MKHKPTLVSAILMAFNPHFSPAKPKKAKREKTEIDQARIEAAKEKRLRKQRARGGDLES